MISLLLFFFFKQKTAYEMRISDWSSDVCSSDLLEANFQFLGNVPYAEILALNRGATALINPSMFEGWSTTVEESKALGTPLLLSDLGVHFEQAGDNAHYFGRADAKDCAAKLAGAARNPPVRNADAAAKQNAIALQA